MMAIAAWVTGVLGGLCAVVGILSAAEIFSFLANLPVGFSPLFWVGLGAVLLLGCVAFTIAHSEFE